jgi:hypothetical protein
MGEAARASVGAVGMLEVIPACDGVELAIHSRVGLNTRNEQQRLDDSSKLGSIKKTKAVD